MEFGVDQGWWPSYDDTGPHPWPIFYILSSKELIKPDYSRFNIYGEPEKTREILDIKYTSQLLVLVCPHIFPSVSQARKSGFGYELREEELWFQKYRMGAVHLYIDPE